MPLLNTNAAFRGLYNYAFQYSPIILVSGIAKDMPGQMIPILALTPPVTAPSINPTNPLAALNPSDFFAEYVPIPGSTLISYAAGEYPFANQQVAANATIEEPLMISLRMIAPVKDSAGYVTKLAQWTALQMILRKHINAGGYFHVATPAFLYTDLLLLNLSDITSAGSKQKQIEYQWDFRKPIITLQSAINAKNDMMSKVTNGQKITTSSTSGAALGSSPTPIVGQP